MKLIAGVVATLIVAEPLIRFEPEDAALTFTEPTGERKLKQLFAQLEHYYPGYDDSRLYGYGCNCFMGELALQPVSYGKPEDLLDGSCRAYQDCLKCAKEEHGDTCVPDYLGYKYGYDVVSDEIVCENSPKSCRRSLCECDKMFAKMQAANYDKFDPNLSVLNAESNWQPEEQCIRGGHNPNSNPKCCGGETMPFYVYNSNIKECCWNGNIALQGKCPPEPTTTKKSTTTTTTTTTTTSASSTATTTTATTTTPTTSTYYSTTPTTTLPPTTTTGSTTFNTPPIYGKK